LLTCTKNVRQRTVYDSYRTPGRVFYDVFLMNIIYNNLNKRLL